MKKQVIHNIETTFTSFVKPFSEIQKETIIEDYKRFNSLGHDKDRFNFNIFFGHKKRLKERLKILFELKEIVFSLRIGMELYRDSNPKRFALIKEILEINILKLEIVEYWFDNFV